MKPLYLLLLISITPFAATPGLDTLVGFDTAWTLVYDGGLYKNGFGQYEAAVDCFNAVTSLPDGSNICTGVSHDTLTKFDQIILIKIDKSGNVLWKKLYYREENQYGYAVVIARNGDFFIGGGCFGAPVIMRTDTAGNQKWSIWHYDSIGSESYLLGTRVTVNSLHETKRGTIICAAGEDYKGYEDLKNYAAFLELDSTGKILRTREWDNITGYKIQGFCIDEASGGGYMLSGNRAVFLLDTLGNAHWQRSYSYMLDGVGSEIAHDVRAKFLRGNRPMIMGRVYEGRCWTLYQKLYYDVWWSPLDDDLMSTTRDTAGLQRGDDVAYDFAQLVNGNIIFIGRKYVTSSDSGGIWSFVTDSTGRKKLWERQTKLPYKTEDGRGVLPLAVCATPDSGFTVVGRYTSKEENGSYNGFATHFVPKDPSVVSSKIAVSGRFPEINAIVRGSKLSVSFDPRTVNPEMTIYNAFGRRITGSFKPGIRQKGNSLEWDFSDVARGVYFYSLKTGEAVLPGAWWRG